MLSSMIRRGAAAALMTCALGAGTALAQDTVKIGVLVPITGNNAADGGRMLKAHELAARQINEAGGIKSLGGAKVELVVADIQSKPEISRSEADRLINRGNVSVLMGAWASATTIPAMQISDRNGVPFIVTSAVTDSITEQGLKNVFRVAPKARWFADNVAAFMADLNAGDTKIRKVALAFEDGPYGQSVSKNYKETLLAKGVFVVAEESFKTGTPDLSTQAAKLKASGADAVLIVSYVDDEVVLLRAMAAQKFTPVIIGFGGGHVHQTLLQAGGIADRTFGIVEWMPDVSKPASIAFVKAFGAAYNNEIPLSNQAQAFASTWIAAMAIDAAASRDPAKVRDALARIKVTDGPAAVLPDDVIEFDERGQNTVGAVVAQVIGGKFVTVWPASVAVQKPVR